MSADKPLDLASIRARLRDAKGPQFWRSLDEVANTDEFRELLHREFPRQASEWLDPVGRRGFLKLMGASLALAGASACTRQPDEVIVPYVRAPENVVPGKPLFFATAMTLGGIATGVLAESHMGRPTKIEGNPDHPASLGATDLLAQGSVLGLYDPDRSQSLTYLNEIRPWSSFVISMQNALADVQPAQGAGLRFLTETIGSPTLAAQFRDILTLLPQAKWHQYEPVSRDHVYDGARLAFGEAVETQYRLNRARVIVSLDADLFGGGPAPVRYARDFANGRRVRAAGGEMNRLFVAEPMPTPTGAVADHRLAAKPTQIEAIARALAAGVSGGPAAATGSSDADKWVAAALKDLQAHRGAGVVVAGPRQPAAVHAMAHALNQALGNVGSTVVHTEAVVADPVDQIASLGELASDIAAGQVKVIVIVGGNPVFTAPADLGFANLLKKVPLRVHHGLYHDETAVQCHWHIPATHYLEEWSDARAFDGTISLVQPLIAPLYGGKSAHEMLGVFANKSGLSSYEHVRARWLQAPEMAAEPERSWRKALHDGAIAGTALPVRNLTPAATAPASSPAEAQATPAAPAGRYEIAFAPDPTIHDGRFANNGWLQELPKPITKVAWDNIAYVSPSTAEALGVKNEDIVEITVRGRTVSAPVWIVPGHSAGTVTVHLGYGRTRAGRIATGIGFNAYALRTADAPWFTSGEIRRTGATQLVACTQGHHSMEGRAIVRAVTLEELRHEPEMVHHMGHTPPNTLTMYPDHPYTGYSWGMAIDQTVCTGCSACVVACQAENNIPVIGKDQVSRGREMHWLRVDRYFEGTNLDAPGIFHQPVLCQQCENAPCEVVCPVAATVHSSEGLNDMVYNRCVGTRYCSHNCPYKVRRFNFLLYQDWDTPSFKLQRNPDVTVRSRGVMEKCTYCVQRINQARQDAKVEGRSIRDGEIVTACEQACPTQAIVFGNVNDPESRVSKLKAEHHDYRLLADLNTKPRTSYLAAIKNPNPELAPALPPREERPPGALPRVPKPDASETNSMKH
jgi:MoCo/4Fe-4S cofactor protein with predicted Tat translocation signal